VLSQGSPDKCVRIYTPEAFEAAADRYTANSPLSRKGRDLRKAFFSRSHHAQLDQQHRLLIPGVLREFAGLSGKVLLIGAGEHLELWEPSEYEAVMSGIDEQLESTLESAGDEQR
jgi:MraZ protein